MSGGAALPALAAPHLLKHDILQCQDKRASKQPPSWEMSIYRGMLQGRHSLPAGAICLKSSCLRAVPVPLQHRVTLCSSCCLLSVTECLTCGWAGIWGFADGTKPRCFLLAFCVPACLLHVGCPLLHIPPCSLRVTQAQRRRPGIPCSSKCLIKVRNPSQPTGTGLRLLTPHPWFSLMSRQQDSIQKAPWALPVPLTSPVA